MWTRALPSPIRVHTRTRGHDCCCPSAHTDQGSVRTTALQPAAGALWSQVSAGRGPGAGSEGPAALVWAVRGRAQPWCGTPPIHPTAAEAGRGQTVRGLGMGRSHSRAALRQGLHTRPPRPPPPHHALVAPSKATEQMRKRKTLSRPHRQEGAGGRGPRPAWPEHALGGGDRGPHG